MKPFSHSLFRLLAIACTGLLAPLLPVEAASAFVSVATPGPAPATLTIVPTNASEPGAAQSLQAVEASLPVNALAIDWLEHAARVKVPKGVYQVRLEELQTTGVWQPARVQHLVGNAALVTFPLIDRPRHSDFRVLAFTFNKFATSAPTTPPAPYAVTHPAPAEDAADTRPDTAVVPAVAASPAVDARLTFNLAPFDPGKTFIPPPTASSPPLMLGATTAAPLAVGKGISLKAAPVLAGNAILFSKPASPATMAAPGKLMPGTALSRPAGAVLSSSTTPRMAGGGTLNNFVQPAAPATPAMSAQPASVSAAYIEPTLQASILELSQVDAPVGTVFTGTVFTGGTLSVVLQMGVLNDSVLLSMAAVTTSLGAGNSLVASFSAASAASTSSSLAAASSISLAAPAAASFAAPVAVESDIWKFAGDRLFYFNQFRGLQVIDIHKPAKPAKLGTLRMPAVGDQIQLLDPAGHYLALFIRKASDAWQSQILIVAVSDEGVPTIAKSIPLDGYLGETRLIGTRLYALVSGMWYDQGQSINLHLQGFDLADPTAPVDLGFASGSGYEPVLQDAGGCLLVSATDYADNSRTMVHAIDISGDGRPRLIKAVKLTGYMHDQFKMSIVAGAVVAVSAVSTKWVYGPQTVTTSGSMTSVRYSYTVYPSHTWLETFSLAGSSTAPLAKLHLDDAAGETLYAVRFDNQRAYVVTYGVKQSEPQLFSSAYSYVTHGPCDPLF
ncbi:MAG: hypothetical protein JWO94_1852, partial [Verrucomicrobiaceae bacterium]|nr:hypothetical protein [Verrucomicrobiaceae bacterium]